MTATKAASAGPVPTGERLAKLRELMRKAGSGQGIHAYVVPSEDAHQSEYIADCDARRAYISGFNGSAGCAVVTEKQAALFTDGRYFLQASKQLDKNWTLMKSGMPDVPTWQEWVRQVLPASGRVGIDPTLIPSGDAAALQQQLGKNATLCGIDENLIDAIWAERPTRPSEPLSVLELQYSGASHQAKITELRSECEKLDAYGFVVSALDEIAWLFNLRGSDIAYNPVFFAYAIVTLDRVILYVDKKKCGRDVLAHLGSQVEIKPYLDIFSDSKELATTASAKKSKLLLGNKASWALQRALGPDTVQIGSPIQMAKAIKNPTELEGFRRCHLRDAAALCNFFGWLQNELAAGNMSIDEVTAADKLEGFRREQADFVGLSFTTISSVGPNAAIIHYSPERGNCAAIRASQIYLCDSGGQYKDGTTDVTRTLHFGKPTEFEMEAYTRVLQGHIAIDMAVFPKGTTGGQ